MSDRSGGTFYNRRARLYNMLFIIALLVGFTIYYRHTHVAAVTYDFQDSYMVLTGAAGSPEPVKIQLSDIRSVTGVREPELGTFVEGFHDDRCFFGTWENEAYGTYTLCAYPKVTEFIVIGTIDGYVVCNYEDNDATRSLCDALLDYLEELGYDLSASDTLNQ